MARFGFVKIMLQGEMVILKTISRRSSATSAEPRHCRWPDDVVEDARAVHDKSEAENLKPFEGFPAQAQADEPDEEGTTGVDRASRGGGKRSRYAQAEEVEAAVD